VVHRAGGHLPAGTQARTRAAPSCSLVIDHIGYQLDHLHTRDTSLVAISRAPFDKLAA
jgi:predicted dithiol-disulfide oxidoreductase (DUF899 family)